jgi:mono/diheme cytochrome c family protein
MRVTGLIALVAVLSSPIPSAASPPIKDTAAAESAPPADMAAFARGAKAWADNCSRCHNMRDPGELSDRQWKVVTTHMRLRAGLDGHQVRDITIFLQGSN